MKYLGGFDCKIEAAKVYNEAAIMYFGEFAQLNEMPGWSYCYYGSRQRGTVVPSVGLHLSNPFNFVEMNKFGISEKNREDLSEIIYHANAVLRLCENSVRNAEKAKERSNTPGGEPFIQSCLDIAAKQKEEAEKEYLELVLYVQNHLATQLVFIPC